jgi:hypothetical protein
LGIIISAMAAALLEAVVPAIWVAAKRGEFDFGRRQLIGWMKEGMRVLSLSFLTF